jgi:hypothetical protein
MRRTGLSDLFGGRSEGEQNPGSEAQQPRVPEPSDAALADDGVSSEPRVDQPAPTEPTDEDVQRKPHLPTFCVITHDIVSARRRGLHQRALEGADRRGGPRGGHAELG